MSNVKRRRLPTQVTDEEQESRPSDNQLIPALPNHIVFEILSRLPIKTLFTCRLICKSWTTFVSNPEFAKLHLPRSPTSLLLKPIYNNRNSRRLHLVDLFTPYDRHNKLKFIPNIDFPNIPPYLVNSCNGLLCLSDFEDTVYISNPILKEYIKLPNCGRQCAIGFSHKTNQYKVVRFSSKILVDPISGLEKTTDDYKAEVYTLGERMWRSVSGNSPCCIGNDSFDSFVHGALHWLSYPSKCREFIHCFDFVSERFRTIREPLDFGPLDDERTDPNLIRVAVLRGQLCICNFNNCHLAIWMMKDYGVRESWSKDFVIESLIYDRKRYCIEPIMIVNDEAIMLLLNNDSLQIYYAGGFPSDVHIYGIRSMFHGISHVPSFISLKDVAKGENVKVIGRK